MAILKHFKTACFLAAASTILVATGCQSDTVAPAQANSANTVNSTNTVKTMDADAQDAVAPAQNQPPAPVLTEGDTTDSQSEVTDTERLEHTQMTAGARAECTMYPDNFDGARLSSLGTHELDLILEDSHSINPLVVYMDVPENDVAQERRLAVGRYLEDRGGLKPEQIEFHAGVNPDTYHAADQQLSDAPKTDTATDGGSVSATANAGSAGGSK
jgi:hypothetical protein